MLKEDTMLRATIVTLAITTLSALAVWNRTNQDNGKLRSRIETLREEKYKLIDSCENLRLDLFNAQIEVGRYELTIDYLNEVNPSVYKKVINFKEHQTE